MRSLFASVEFSSKNTETREVQVFIRDLPFDVKTPIWKFSYSSSSPNFTKPHWPPLNSKLNFQNSLPPLRLTSDITISIIILIIFFQCP